MNQNKLKDMSRVFRETLYPIPASIEVVDEELKSQLQSFKETRTVRKRATEWNNLVLSPSYK